MEWLTKSLQKQEYSCLEPKYQKTWKVTKVGKWHKYYILCIYILFYNCFVIRLLITK